jgi:hypothetical protein
LTTLGLAQLPVVPEDRRILQTTGLSAFLSFQRLLSIENLLEAPKGSESIF